MAASDPESTIVLRPIGVMRSPYLVHHDAPRQPRRDGDVVSEPLAHAERYCRRGLITPSRGGQRRRKREDADQDRHHVAAVEGGAIRRPRVAQAKR